MMFAFEANPVRFIRKFPGGKAAISLSGSTMPDVETAGAAPERGGEFFHRGDRCYRGRMFVPRSLEL
jgi:hypothetical protein